MGEKRLQQLEAESIGLKNRDAELRGSIFSLEEESRRLRGEQERALQELLDTLAKNDPAALGIFYTAIYPLSQGIPLYRTQFTKKEIIAADILNNFSVRRIGEALTALKRSGLLSISKKDRITASRPEQIWAHNYVRTHHTAQCLPYFLQGLKHTHPDTALLFYPFLYLAPEAPIQLAWFEQQPFVAVPETQIQKFWSMQRQPFYALCPKTLKTHFATLEKYGLIQSEGELLHIPSAVHLLLQAYRPAEAEEILSKVARWLDTCIQQKQEETKIEWLSAFFPQEMEEIKKQKGQKLDPLFIPHLKHIVLQQLQEEHFKLSTIVTQSAVHLFYPFEEILQYDLYCLKMHLQYRRNNHDLNSHISTMRQHWCYKEYQQSCRVSRQVEFFMHMSDHFYTAENTIQEGITPAEEVLSKLEHDLNTCIQTWKISMQDMGPQEEKVITLQTRGVYRTILTFWEKRAFHLSVDPSKAKIECEKIVLPLLSAFTCLSPNFPIPCIWLTQGKFPSTPSTFGIQKGVPTPQEIEEMLTTLEKMGCVYRPDIDMLQINPQLQHSILERIFPYEYDLSIKAIGEWLRALSKDTDLTSKRGDLLALHLEYLCEGYRREQAQFSPDDYFLLKGGEKKVYRKTLEPFHINCWATLFSALGRTYFAQKE